MIRVIVADDAAREIELADAWWAENREDAPSLLRTSVADALDAIAEIGPVLPVFRTLSGRVACGACTYPGCTSTSTSSSVTTG